MELLIRVIDVYSWRGVLIIFGMMSDYDYIYIFIYVCECIKGARG